MMSRILIPNEVGFKSGHSLAPFAVQLVGYPMLMSIRDENADRGYGEEGRTREEQDRAAEGGTHRDNADERVPSSTEDQDELVDRASEDSFPASDAPSYSQRAAPHRAEENKRTSSPS